MSMIIVDDIWILAPIFATVALAVPLVVAMMFRVVCSLSLEASLYNIAWDWLKL